MLRTNYIILNWWPSFHFIKRYLFYYSSAKRTRKRQSLVNDFCIQDATESRTITACLLKNQKLKCSQSECYTVVLPRTIFQRSTDSSIIYSTNKTGWENWSSYYQLSYYALHTETDLYGHTPERNIGLKNCGKTAIIQHTTIPGNIFKCPGQRLSPL